MTPNRFNLQISQQLSDTLTKIAAEKGVSKADVVRLAVEAYTKNGK